MNFKIRWVVIIFSLLFLFACKDNGRNKLALQLEQWNGKKIIFPESLVFTMQGKDTLNYRPKGIYTIINYVDSMGCFSCKLQFQNWNFLKEYIDSVAPYNVPILFVLNPKDKKEMIHILQENKFRCPICIDLKGVFNNLNHLENDLNFQTFLLDENDKIIAIGNPIYNSKVKDLYLNIILGNEISFKNINHTDVVSNVTSFYFGKFDWKKEKKCTFILTNVGNKALALMNVLTSCGCTSVKYSKEPVPPGKSVNIEVTYKAEHPEHFEKTITVYCNAPTSPLQLKIKGDAE